ncbi:MAG: hypothetical protein AB7N91_08160 [Candidatus Tectimicrobiota bacterium]
MALEVLGTILKFSGRNRLEAKQKALQFWYTHQDVLQESMREFVKHCTLSPDQKVITYRRPTAS